MYNTKCTYLGNFQLSYCEMATLQSVHCFYVIFTKLLVNVMPIFLTFNLKLQVIHF